MATEIRAAATRRTNIGTPSKSFKEKTGIAHKRHRYWQTGRVADNTHNVGPTEPNGNPGAEFYLGNIAR
jgi:hypothetical protein